MYARRWTLNAVRLLLTLRARYEFWFFKRYKSACLSPVPALSIRYVWQKLTKYSPPRRIFDRLDLLSFGCPLLFLPALSGRPPQAAACPAADVLPSLQFGVRSSELAARRSSTYCLLPTTYCTRSVACIL
jgi:hypothetical protein